MPTTVAVISSSDTPSQWLRTKKHAASSVTTIKVGQTQSLLDAPIDGDLRCAEPSSSHDQVSTVSHETNDEDDEAESVCSSDDEFDYDEDGVKLVRIIW